MSQEIILPDLGMDTDEALLIDWTKKPGDSVKQGDVIAEVETDKTTVEVESPVSGTILEWKYEAGAELKIGEVIGFVGEAGEAAPSGGNGSAAPAQQDAAPAPEPVQQQAPAAQPAAVHTNGSGSGADVAARTPDGRIKASPIAKRIADERGINLAQISGSGPGGRIVKVDVETFTPSAPAPAPAAPAPQPAAAPAALPDNLGFLAPPTFGKLPEGEDYEYEDVSRLRNRIAERMTTSQQQVPHFYVTMEVNVDELLSLRKELNADVEDKADRISVNDMIVKAVALAARRVPNANRHWYGDQYVVNKKVNVGIAVALDNGGLMNVVSHEADRISLRTMARENREKIMRAREGKVSPADVKGETITVSNLGMYGVDNFIAIVNPPGAAIVAVGTSKPTPIVKDDGTIGVATLMKLTLSADHRTLNGAEGGEFMRELKTLLESPRMLI
ncbi:MAG: dihydrolipoamide acetyltransferase family protein [Chloroflexota bacterium]